MIGSARKVALGLLVSPLVAHSLPGAAATNGDASAESAQARRPNVLLILTDDQGYGDFSTTGNPVLATPNIDRLAAASTEITHFYVSPVCTPSRAALMTGRNHIRSAGVTLLHPDEWTLGEMFAADAYRTGIFGKWNLGDNHPQRPTDQGFHEALVLRGSHIGPLSDPLHGSYFDPTLWRNDEAVATEGFITDVLTDAACAFIAAAQEQPFFVYLPYNVPHNPLEAPEAYLALYADADVSPAAMPEQGRAFQAGYEERTRRLYAMLANLDDNIGRLLAHLDALDLARDTIVVYLSDNGPQHQRWNGGLRGIKGSVYEGGIRTPCWIRWPAELPAGRRVERFGAHVDLAPTLLEACGIRPPPNVRFDGRSLWPLLSDPGAATDWPDRQLVFQWHLGDEPRPWRACAVRGERYKLVQAGGVGMADLDGRRVFELFEPALDPFEERDLSSEHPDVVAALSEAYDAWFADARAERCFELPRIVLGSQAENPLELQRTDLRGRPPETYWNVDVLDPGPYRATLWLGPSDRPRELLWRLGTSERRSSVPAHATEATLDDLALPPGPGRLEVHDQEGDRPLPVWLIRLTR